MLSRDLARYVDQKRSLGFKFQSQNIVLSSFVRFAKERGDRYIRNARVLARAAQSPSPEHRRARLLLVASRRTIPRARMNSINWRTHLTYLPETWVSRRPFGQPQR
jgi:hypothetical protein